MLEPKFLKVSPRLLRPNPWNTNYVSPENELKIEESIKRQGGLFKPILVRELVDGTLEILGGEHRAKAASRLGFAEVPVFNLGKLSDQQAKEIGLIDNGRYGEDDSLQLAELLKSLGNADELQTFLPYSDDDLNSIFSTTSIALDELEISDDEELPSMPATPAAPTHQLMRFKVPVEDVARVTQVIEKIMKEHGYTEEDSFTNAGHALVQLALSAS